MGMIGRLIKTLAPGFNERRSWTPAEIRHLIALEQLDKAFEATRQLTEALTDQAAERSCLLGEISFQRREDEAAMGHFREALRSSPGLREAHYGLSLVLAEQKAYDDAVRHAQFALGPHGQEARYLAQVGYCHLSLGNMQMAEAALRRATLVTADNAFVWSNLGVVMRAKGDLHDAKRLFELALKLKPDLGTAAGNLAAVQAELASGFVTPTLSGENTFSLRPKMPLELDEPLPTVLQLERDGALKEAVDLCEALTLERPDNGMAAIVLSSLYERVGDLDSAVDALNAHLASHPDAAEVAGALGLVLLRAQDFGAAEIRLRTAVEQSRDHLDYVLGLGQALARQERYGEAGPILESGLVMAPANPTVVAMLAANRSNECRYEEALQLIDGLGELRSRIPWLGSVLGFMGRYDEALELATAAVERQPNDPGLRFQRAQLRLLSENFEQGWDDYAFRGLSNSKDFRMLPLPLWRGEQIEGKRIIVLAEQGLGDQVMFASCLADLLEMRPAEVIVEAHVRVAKTIARSFPACQVIPSQQNASLDWVKDFPDADMFVPLPDLAARFRRSRDAFPMHTGYLKPDPGRIAHWRLMLEAQGPGPYVGVSWKGGTEGTRRPVRSLLPEELAPLAAARPDVRWVCLQYGDVTADVQRMSRTAMPMAYWPDSIRDLDEFAALISALDLIITVCNTTVHYAGALGKAVWVLCPTVPEWRYGNESLSLPWYPSSRVLRQTVRGDWSGPLTVACRDLSAWVPAGRGNPPIQG